MRGSVTVINVAQSQSSSNLSEAGNIRSWESKCENMCRVRSRGQGPNEVEKVIVKDEESQQKSYR